MGKLVCIAGIALALGGCGRGALTTRTVDTPKGSTVAYGAPRDQSYTFEAEPELDAMRVRVYRAARCDVIPTDIVARRTETLEGDRVISSVDQGPVQIAKQATTDAPCDQGYARDVIVSFVVGNAVHPVGTTDAFGYVGVNLSAELREKLLGAGTPEKVTVRVRPPKAMAPIDLGPLPLTSLKEFEAGVARQLDELNALLAKGNTLSSPDILKAYDLYAKLQALAWYDPRFKASSARFWELFFARKQQEQLDRNLKALDQAKDLLKGTGGTVPWFMQVAIASQIWDPRAVDWASLMLLSELRGKPQLCSTFDWSKMGDYGFPPAAQVAVQYLRFAQGDAFFGPTSSRCSFMTRG